jgi:hypothetical protein
MHVEEDIPSQLLALESSADSKARNALALHLAEAKVPGLEQVLVRLIERPGLSDSRGTLVHALSYFDCSKYLSFLVGLVAAGNWEVAHEALQALETIDEVDAGDVERAFTALKRAQAAQGLEDWRRILLDDLSEMFG